MHPFWYWHNLTNFDKAKLWQFLKACNIILKVHLLNQLFFHHWNVTLNNIISISMLRLSCSVWGLSYAIKKLNGFLFLWQHKYCKALPDAEHIGATNFALYRITMWTESVSKFDKILDYKCWPGKKVVLILTVHYEPRFDRGLFYC